MYVCVCMYVCTYIHTYIIKRRHGLYTTILVPHRIGF